MIELSSLSGSNAYAYSVQNYLSLSNTKSSQTESSQELAGLEAMFEKAGNSSSAKETGTGQIGLSDDTLQAIFQSLGAGGTQAAASPDVSAMDTDGDGMITQEEFLAARPDDVTEEMATNLWNSFDTEGAGSLSTDELETAMAANRPGGPPPAMASSEDDSSTDSVSALDTNGDGIVSQAEFLAGRPDDVTEEMAQALWDSFDTEGTGEMEVSEIEEAMTSNQTTSTDSSQTTSLSSLDMLLNAIKSYQSTAQYGNSQFMMDSLYGSLA